MATEQDKIVDTQYNTIPLIFDTDDVILNSKKTVIEIINEQYNLSPGIKEENIKDWDFTYVKRILKRQKGIDLYNKDFLEIFETKEFWEKVEIKKEFLDIISNNEIRKYYRIVIVSVGTNKNLQMKEEYLQQHLNMAEMMFLKIPTDLDNPKYGKKALNEFYGIRSAIQIDDKYECLNTDAKLKILLKNNKDTDYNEVLDIREDLYVINDLSELKDILMFISNASNEFFKDRRTLIV